MPSSYVDLHIFSKDGSTELHNATLNQNVYASFVITQSGYTSNGTAVSVSYGADILGWATTANSSEADFDIDSSYEYHTIFPDADGSSPKTFNYYIVTGSTTYKHILKDGSKVQVDSAIRDGNGVKIDTNYEKLSNKVTSVSSSSTNTQYPSAKLLYDKISDVTEIAEGKTANYVISDASQTGYENSSFNATTDTISIEYTNKKIKDVLGNDINLSDLKVGDIVSITETNVPDRWVGAKTTTGTPTMTFYKLETKITIDSSPTSSSTNPVSSGGVYTALGDKMDKSNPTGTGSFSLNRKANTTVGTNSVAVGNNNTASAQYSFATGYNNTASNTASFVEGGNNTASGGHSHAEGGYTTASGTYAHSEGNRTVASGNNSHAEGSSTKAQSKAQHTFGEYNVLDNTGSASTRGTYVEIVGNGTEDNARSNARTLDWSGNEVLSGTLQTTGLKDGNNANYKLALPNTTSWTADKTIATTDQIPTDTNTWRPIKVNGTEKLTNSTSGNALDLVAGTNVSLSESSGAVTITATDTTYATINDNYNASTNKLATASDLPDISTKMDKANATGTGTLNINRKANTTSGDYSATINFDNTSSGASSFTNGQGNVASGGASHAEGFITTASGSNSHAEGYGTIAQGDNQHAFGKFNIASNSKAEVVGNGTADNARSNIRTLDWSGNEWIAGNLQASGLTDGITTKTMTQILAGGGSVDIDNTSITENSSNKIQTVGVIDQKTSSANKQWTGTKVQYDAITTKDANTFYYVTDAVGSAYTKANIDASNLTTSNASSWRQAIIKAQTLWTNSSPTSNFNAQDITLSSSDYDYLIVRIIINTTETKYINTIVKKGAGTTLLQYSTTSTGSGYYIMSQYRDMTYVNDTKYSISANTYGRTGGSATNRQDLNIPYDIVGIKLL